MLRYELKLSKYWIFLGTLFFYVALLLFYRPRIEEMIILQEAVLGGTLMLNCGFIAFATTEREILMTSKRSVFGILMLRFIFTFTEYTLIMASIFPYTFLTNNKTTLNYLMPNLLISYFCTTLLLSAVSLLFCIVFKKIEDIQTCNGLLLTFWVGLHYGLKMHQIPLWYSLIDPFYSDISLSSGWYWNRNRIIISAAGIVLLGISMFLLHNRKVFQKD